MKILTVGTFDLTHYGHVDLFKWCRLLAGDGEVVVGVNPDEFIEKFKGKKPINSLEERMSMVESIKYVDRVVENSGGEDSKILINMVKPDIIVIGSDWMKKDYCKQMMFTPEWLEEKRIALVYIPRHISISTTTIKSRI